MRVPPSSSCSAHFHTFTRHPPAPATSTPVPALGPAGCFKGYARSCDPPGTGVSDELQSPLFVVVYTPLAECQHIWPESIGAHARFSAERALRCSLVEHRVSMRRARASPPSLARILDSRMAASPYTLASAWLWVGKRRTGRGGLGVVIWGARKPSLARVAWVGEVQVCA